MRPPEGAHRSPRRSWGPSWWRWRSWCAPRSCRWQTGSWPGCWARPAPQREGRVLRSRRLGLARACASAAACMLSVRCPRGTAGPGVRGCAAAPCSYRRPGTRLDGITPAPRELAGGLSALHARVHGQDLEAAGGGQGRGASDLSHALRRRGQNVASKAAAQASPSQPLPALPSGTTADTLDTSIPLPRCPPRAHLVVAQQARDVLLILAQHVCGAGRVGGRGWRWGGCNG